jgi:hypothetical protein
MQLCYNKTIFTTTIKRGLFRPSIPKKKRIQLDDPDEEPVEKRYKGTCQGHKKTDCSFLEQGHPDVNMENNPWPDSIEARVYYQETLATTLCTRIKYLQKRQGSDQSLESFQPSTIQTLSVFTELRQI